MAEGGDNHLMDANYVEVSIGRRDIHLAEVVVSARVGQFSGLASGYFGVKFATGVCTALVEFADSLESYPMPPEGSIPLRAYFSGEADSPMAIDLQAFGVDTKGGVVLNVALRSSSMGAPPHQTHGYVEVRFPTDIASLQRWAPQLRQVAATGAGVARIETE